MEIIKRIPALFFLGLFGFAAIGQQAEDEKVMQGRIRENIHTLRLLRMTQALELTEEQAARIFPFISRVEKDKMDIHRRIGREIRELRNLIRKEQIDNEAVTEKLRSISRLRVELRDKDEETERFLEENLTLLQRAKYILFSIDFYRGIGEKLDRARMIREKSGKKREISY